MIRLRCDVYALPFALPRWIPKDSIQRTDEEWHATQPTQARRITPRAHHARLHPPRRGVGADRVRRDESHLYRERARAAAAAPERHDAGLGDRRVRHAAAL